MFFEIFSYLRCDFIFDLCFLFCFFTEKTAISFEIKYDEFIKINIKFIIITQNKCHLKCKM